MSRNTDVICASFPDGQKPEFESMWRGSLNIAVFLSEYADFELPTWLAGSNGLEIPPKSRLLTLVVSFGTAAGSCFAFTILMSQAPVCFCDGFVVLRTGRTDRQGGTVRPPVQR